MATRRRRCKRHLCCTMALKRLFLQLRAYIKHCNQTRSVARRRRVYLPRSGDYSSFQTFGLATGKIVTTGNIKTWPHRHRFTAEEYNWMAEIGLLNGEPAVELIEGEIIHMAPMGTQHGNVVQRLHTALKTALAGRALISIQRVFRLSNITEAQPDLIVLKPGRDYHSAKFPTGSDTLLVIEVSDTTFSYDHDIKVPLYAAHDVPEVWIVDLESRCVRFFRGLVDGKYTDVQVVEEPALAKVADFPDTNIDLSGLLI